jgi:hypothetical protein
MIYRSFLTLFSGSSRRKATGEKSGTGIIKTYSSSSRAVFSRS